MHLLHKLSSCKIWFVQMLCSTQMSTKKQSQKKESQWNHHTSLLRSKGSTSSGTDEDAKRPKVLLLMGLKYSSTVMRSFKTKMQKKMIQTCRPFVGLRQIYVFCSWFPAIYPARARSARARRARALRALGLLLADGTPTGGRGEDFLNRQPNFLRKQL